MTVWKLDPNYSDKEYALYTTDYGYVGSIWKTAEYSEKGDFYAAFIVRACNSHDELIEALEYFLDDGEANGFKAAKARAALAKAKGE